MTTLLHLYQAAGQFGAVSAVARHLIETVDRDNWVYYEAYFKALQELLTQPAVAPHVVVVPLAEGGCELPVDATFALAAKFMEKLVEREMQVRGVARFHGRGCG